MMKLQAQTLVSVASLLIVLLSFLYQAFNDDKTQMEKIMVEITKLHTCMDNLKKAVHDLSESVDKLAVKVYEQETDVAVLKSDVKRLKK